MLLAALFALSGCDDTIFPAVSHGGGPGGETGYCGVQAIFAGDCLMCHSASVASGGLDLETDAHAALVGVASSLYAGNTLVVEGDPDASFLMLKLDGTQDPTTEGGVMPPTGVLPAESLQVVRDWIADGASAACDDPVDDTGTPAGYHPEGWEAPEVHGLSAKIGEQACGQCHGGDLAGGATGVSCDDCHADGWRTDCTFCHGGEDNLTGAPPEGIRDETDASLTSFPPHTAHVSATALKSAFDCVQCHVKPTDVLSSGHLFVGDTTFGVAEVAFGAGLSTAAEWDGTNGTCSNLYCHGNGQGDNGTMVATGAVACGDCHAVGEDDGGDGWDGMSGQHEEHLDEGVTCSECHGETVNSSNTIAHPERHVNGTVDVLLAGGMTRVGDGCSGTCHEAPHNPDIRKWED